MVSGFTAHHKMAEPATHKTAENASAWGVVSSPLAVGRQAVRFMRWSMCCSMRQLKAAAAPETSQIPSEAQSARVICAMVGTPGTASTMPIRAQNTISCITRGFMSAWYCCQRVVAWVMLSSVPANRP